jgi:uncharacterized protein YjbI with pentapeptide repeats
MPSEWIAQHIDESLAEGERQEDFEYMVDTLTQMRRPYHPEAPYEEVVEAGAGKILCLLLWPKPRSYVDSMRRFRTLFKGIADSLVLQATFANSVLPAALTAGEQLEYSPSLYFSWEPILSSGNLERADLQGADLRGAALDEANLFRANLKRANLRGSYLRRAALHGAILEKTNLRFAQLERAELPEARLQGANLQRANLQRANLFGANLQEADLQEADLQRVDLQEANLQRANLQEARLQEARLQGANLFGAYLQGANLQGAYLQGTYLQGANLQAVQGLTQEQLERAVGDEDTELPEYVSVPAAWS